MIDALHHYREIWLIDFEYSQPAGERIGLPHCMVAREFRTGRTLRVWADDLANMAGPSFPVGADILIVAYYASAEMGAFLGLGWQMPARVLDLFTEFRCLTNGLSVPCGNGLLGALAYHGLGAIGAAEKDDMRDLAIRGAPFTAEERLALLDYCESDVVALAKLLPAMLPRIDLPRALLRGRYMAAVAAMEWNGTPIDVKTLELLRTHWEAVQSRLIAAVDQDYGVYVPAGRRLSNQSALGEAILRTAADYEIDPYSLADAVEIVIDEDRSARAAQQSALTAARKATGVNARRIADWERAGQDHSTWPGWDVKARELAGQYPELGIGSGYEEYVFDDTDYGGQLWALLRDGSSRVLPRHDPSILRRAAEMVPPAGDETVPGKLSFSSRRFAEWLARNDIPWPRLTTGQLALDDNTFRQMARSHSAVASLRELRHSLGEMRLFSNLAVGQDGRNRCLLSPFRSRTSRNQPSNAKFIFGPSVWLRGLIKPAQGQAVAYVDWSQQEFGIAAALSGPSTRTVLLSYSLINI